MLSPGAEPGFPSLRGAFPASPSKSLAEGFALSKLRRAWRTSLLCPGAGGAELAPQLRALREPSGQPSREKSPPQARTPPLLQGQTPPVAIAGTQQGKQSQELAFPEPLPPYCPQITAEAGSEPGEAQHLPAHPTSSPPPSTAPMGSPPSAQAPRQVATSCCLPPLALLWPQSCQTCPTQGTPNVPHGHGHGHQKGPGLGGQTALLRADVMGGGSHGQSL